ncbi:NACHT, LRR and PYD domains-containing protein 1b allele 2-like isoform X2 [Meleagris gallopavo]|uniref:NACHT, LRR and PYD domains-containing protein 1b allele 2-like isoform X2 n=1 Tax=Meleagris gallopavo TaxID=9103 RepID=UPI000549BF98|nr:NACHT, LRR and PYD domains-containing protein 1b allele 2-like isoform X2 [Meleagris gallopavo]
MASGGSIENAVTRLLWNTLKVLEEHDFQKFKRELSKIQPKEGYERIELESVAGLSPAALATLLYSHYGRSHCVEVTVEVLRAIGQVQQAEHLLDMLQTGERFVEKNKEFLTQQAYNVERIIEELLQEGVLSSTQRDSIMAESTNQKRMQKLYELVPVWDATAKYCLYNVLRRNTLSLFLQYAGDELTLYSSAFESWIVNLDAWMSNTQALFYSTASKLREQVGKLFPFTTPAGSEDKPFDVESSSGTGSSPKCMACSSQEEDGAEEVKPEITGGKDGKKEIYRAHFPRSGFFRCTETDLKFLVRMATTIEYEYSFWESHLPAGIPSEWMEAGPVFDIRAEPRAVEAIHLPHFLCLSERKLSVSEMCIGHVVDGNLYLEKPDAVRPFHAVLRNPSFSPMGVILLSASFPFIPVHCLVLLYRVIRAADITLHLYLIPNNHGLEKAVEKDEKRRGHSFLVDKPPHTSRPLKFNTRYRVSSPSEAEINPQELKFIYLTSDSRQLYTEIYSKDLQEGMQLTLTKASQEGKMEHSPLWATFLRAGDIKPPVAFSTSLCSDPSLTEHQPSSSLQAQHKGLHFVEQHREQLIQRVTSVSPVLDQLYGHVLTNEQYQSIRGMPTPQEQMRLLYSFMPSWDVACKDLFLDALKKTNNHLLQDLQGQ